MLSKSRTMFAKHRLGHIFPVLMNAKAMEEGIAGAMQKINTTDEFVWFYSKSLTVVAGTALSLAALGVSGSSARVTSPDFAPLAVTQFTSSCGLIVTVCLDAGHAI